MRSVARKFANSIASLLAISVALLLFSGFRTFGLNCFAPQLNLCRRDRRIAVPVQHRWSDLMNCAARSPMTTHGAIVFPVVIRGMIEASATRRLPRP